MTKNSSSSASLPCEKMKGKSTRKRKASLSEQDWNPGGGGGEDELVKTEIDAAEALAQFSQQAHSVKEVSIVELWWGNKGKRSARSRRQYSAVSKLKQEEDSESEKEGLGNDVPPVVYNRFDTSEDSLEPVFRAESPSSPLPPLPTEGSSAFVKMEVQESAFKPVLMDLDDKSDVLFKKRDGQTPLRGRRSYSADLSTSSSIRGRGVTKLALTDEEKELRKMRRIEANRESARQTIRRKQEACDRLTKKAGELSFSNEKYKQELAKLKQECRGLYEENCSMRQQLGVDTNVQLPFDPSVWRESKQDSAANSVAMRMWLSARNAQLPPFFSRPSATASSSKVEPSCFSVQVNMQDSLDAVDSTMESTRSPHHQQQQLDGFSSSSSSSCRTLQRMASAPPFFRSSSYMSSSQQVMPQQQQRQILQQQQHHQQHQHQQQQHYQHYQHQQQLQVAFQQHSYYTGRKDAVSVAAAAQARRKRMELTRRKSLRHHQAAAATAAAAAAAAAVATAATT